MGSTRSPRGCGVKGGDRPSEVSRGSSLELELINSARRFAKRSDKPEGVVDWYCWTRFGLSVSSNAELKEEDVSPGEDRYRDIAGGILGIWDPPLLLGQWSWGDGVGRGEGWLVFEETATFDKCMVWARISFCERGTKVCLGVDVE